MKGTQIISLSHESVQEAIAEYLNRHFITGNCEVESWRAVTPVPINYGEANEDTTILEVRFKQI